MPSEFQKRDLIGRLLAIQLAGSVAFGMPAKAQTVAEESLAATAWRVRLLAPLTTGFSRKGDIVSASVVVPAAYRGSILEGVIREIKPAGATGKDSIVRIEFTTLHAPNADMTVTAELLGESNSRGQVGVDEAGNPLAAGGKELSMNPTAAPQHRSPLPLRLSARAGGLSLAPGSELALQVKTKQNR